MPLLFLCAFSNIKRDYVQGFVKGGISDSKMNGYVLGGRGSVLGWSTDSPLPPL